MSKLSVNRRKFLCIGSATLAAPFVFTGNRAFAADSIVVADNGGAPAKAAMEAFYKPFTEKTGINVVSVAHDPDPTVQFKLIVDLGTGLWDCCSITPVDLANLNHDKYLEPLNLGADAPELIPGMMQDYWAGYYIWAMMQAHRTDTFADGRGPMNWTEFWDVDTFKGRRGLYRSPEGGMLEAALMADGVAAKDLYPLDVDRAFKSLDRIKMHIDVWWTTGAQNTQILFSGEVAMTDTWSARASAAIEGGAPVEIAWSQGIMSSGGWGIVKNTPKADMVREFIKFSLDPKQQALYSSKVANSPTNPKTFDYISLDRAKVLATAPDNIKGLVPYDEAFWSKNRSAMVERFNDWILG